MANTGFNLVWLRQDLRLKDNPALSAASRTELPCACVYILDDATAGSWATGGAQRWWLHHSLSLLKKDLEDRGIPLLLLKGKADLVWKEILKAAKPKGVYWNRLYEPYHISRDSKIKQFLKLEGVHAESFNGSLLAEPWEIKTKTGTPFKVFTPFWKSCLSTLSPGRPEAEPSLQGASLSIDGDQLEDWELLPKRTNWAGGIAEMWTPGEAGAHQRLTQFLRVGCADYKEGRDYPAKRCTSLLSPHLHWGEISPREVWHKVREWMGRHDAAEVKQAEHFLSEMGWREFSYHLLYHNPLLPTEPFDKRFGRFKWAEDKTGLKAWQRGMTGYPIVDAGMRELWHTGWMHNRVRMIVASFLTKDLFIHWIEGARWFWDTLVDADLANNSASWQWTAGCGADAAPYFRIFNPVLQGERFDPDGLYIKRWCPELGELPKKWIHKPWEASGFRLDYPAPIVDHATQRDLALAKYQELKSEG